MTVSPQPDRDGLANPAMLNGHTRLIAHIGYPTTTFRSPTIYNPWFERHGINAAVVPLGVTAENFPRAFPEICRLSNFHGALITMPHKASVIALLDDVSTAVRIAGSCNAVRRSDDGRLAGDTFDGEGFVRAAARRGQTIRGKSLLVVGAGGVGSAIAASSAAAGAAEITLHDLDINAASALAGRLREHYPRLRITVGSNHPGEFDIVVNATPLGTHADDPLPLDAARLSPSAYVADVVMGNTTTPLLEAAEARGCRTQPGIDMLFEQIPAYLAFFGFPPASADELRRGSG